MNDQEFECLALLECAEAWETLPTECDTAILEKDGLIQRFSGGWKLTDVGRLRLENLRAAAEHARQVATGTIS